MSSAALERAAAACLFPPFEGLEPPPWLYEWIERGLGGVVLFGRNIRDREQLADLTGALHAARPDLLVATDEEGGDVTRLETATGSSYPGNYALGVVDDTHLTERVAAALGGDLAAAGIDLDLAPVADVNTDSANPVIGVRSFGADPELVARHVAAFVRGLQSGGVAACAKHFPGHGDTTVDSHLDLPVVAASLETLRSRELVPFRAAVDAGVAAIMTAHLRVPALDEAPATLSARILQGLLREELGFEGLVITDALEMRAISGGVGIGEGAVRALEAGADALCLGADVGRAEVERVWRAILARVPEERLHEAAGRVAATARPSANPTPVDRGIALEAARRALRVEGAVELARPPAVVELRPEPSIAAGEAAHSFADVLGVEPVTLREPRQVDLDPSRQLVLVVQDAHRHEWEREAAEALLGAAGGGVVVETGIPEWRPRGATGYVATYGAGRVNLDAASERLAPRARSD